MGFRDKISAQKFYDCISDNYEEQLKDGMLANTIRRQFHRKLLSNFSFGNRILDIGCGTGIDAVFLASNKIYVTATDISPKMIAKALQKVTDSGLCEFIRI
jgi:ubiquinone/menaquinone biosynthesis C-methylase UbiE